ncbi:hypothetical protein CEXT_272441 [Caerostris extrusa]|uniref:Uncharacterized protein n=1 Tax=Caerostris extrusa TaxID=172846 RepID=A0AAV4YBU0_CAEEX|nr:hypothetical protein CEXT_272441 [Caerostris extrusa]
MHMAERTAASTIQVCKIGDINKRMTLPYYSSYLQGLRLMPGREAVHAVVHQQFSMFHSSARQSKWGGPLSVFSYTEQILTWHLQLFQQINLAELLLRYISATFTSAKSIKALRKNR